MKAMRPAWPADARRSDPARCPACGVELFRALSMITGRVHCAHCGVRLIGAGNQDQTTWAEGQVYWTWDGRQWEEHTA